MAHAQGFAVESFGRCRLAGNLPGGNLYQGPGGSTARLPRTPRRPRTRWAPWPMRVMTLATTARSTSLSRSIAIPKSSFQAQPKPIHRRVQTNNAEIIGSYIFRLPSKSTVKPYALIGGGMVRFSPNRQFHHRRRRPPRQSKPAFAYGFGTDFKVDRPLGRAPAVSRTGPQRAGLRARQQPSPFGTGLKTHVAEPSIRSSTTSKPSASQQQKGRSIALRPFAVFSTRAATQRTS